jgi:isoleucyl-tRNA synthetase
MSKKTLNFTTPPVLPELELEVLNFWNQNETFKKSVESRAADKAYIFYDGPPFATGMPHYGHLLASTTKDVIPRYQTMQGKRVERVWGWDARLPIENMIEKTQNSRGKKGIEALGIDKFNQACRAVLRLDSEWERIIGRLGRCRFQSELQTMDKISWSQSGGVFSNFILKAMFMRVEKLFCIVLAVLLRCLTSKLPWTIVI